MRAPRDGGPLCFVGCTHRLKRCELRFLASGHCHEDVDGFFGVVAGWLERETELADLMAFRQSLERMLANRELRVHEPVREVHKVDQVRDWPRLAARHVLCLLERCRCLGFTWVVRSRAISALNRAVSRVAVLMSLLLTTHGPASRVLALLYPFPLSVGSKFPYKVTSPKTGSPS